MQHPDHCLSYLMLKRTSSDLKLIIKAYLSNHENYYTKQSIPNIWNLYAQSAQRNIRLVRGLRKTVHIDWPDQDMFGK